MVQKPRCARFCIPNAGYCSWFKMIKNAKTKDEVADAAKDIVRDGELY